MAQPCRNATTAATYRYYCSDLSLLCEIRHDLTVKRPCAGDTEAVILLDPWLCYCLCAAERCFDSGTKLDGHIALIHFPLCPSHECSRVRRRRRQVRSLSSDRRPLTFHDWAVSSFLPLRYRTAYCRCSGSRYRFHPSSFSSSAASAAPRADRPKHATLARNRPVAQSTKTAAACQLVDEAGHLVLSLFSP